MSLLKLNSSTSVFSNHLFIVIKMERQIHARVLNIHPFLSHKQIICVLDVGNCIRGTRVSISLYKHVCFGLNFETKQNEVTVTSSNHYFQNTLTLLSQYQIPLPDQSLIRCKITRVVLERYKHRIDYIKKVIVLL